MFSFVSIISELRSLLHFTAEQISLKIYLCHQLALIAFSLRDVISLKCLRDSRIASFLAQLINS